MEQKINIFESYLVPKHEILNDEQKAELLSAYKTDLTQLPRISVDDPVSKARGAKRGDVIKITRESKGNTVLYFRVVV